MNKRVWLCSGGVVVGVLLLLGFQMTGRPAVAVRAASAEPGAVRATGLPGTPPAAGGSDGVRVPGGGRMYPQPPGSGVFGRPAPSVAPPVAAAGPGTSNSGNWSLKAPYPYAIHDEAVVAQGGLLYSFVGSGTSNYKYDPTADTWTGIAGLPSGADQASAVSDGTYLYILNGRAGSPQNTLYRYDPPADSYTILAPAPRATANQAAVYLGGKIYRIAGWDAGGLTASVDVYTVSTNTWAPAGTVADYPLAVSGLVATAAGGYVYAAGGAFLDAAVNKTYRYDPASNTWDDNAVADLPQQFYGGAGDILNGRWILAGGYAADYQIDKNVVALDVSSPASAWVGLPWMPAWRWFTGGAAAGGAFYIVGGYDLGEASSAVQQYREGPGATASPAPTGTSPTGASPTPFACGTGAWQGSTAYPIPVGAAAAAVQDGVIYNFAGLGNSVGMANAYKFDPVAGTWAAIAHLPAALIAPSAVSDGTYLYILNGSDTVGHTNQHTLYRYDPLANSYTTLAPAPTATYGQAAVYLAGKIYRIAGHGTGSVDVYTISTDSWAPAGTVASYPLAAEAAAAIADGGFIYVAGGYTPGPTAKTYRYDPASNTWDDAAVADLPLERAAAATGLLNGRWLLAGGQVPGAPVDPGVVALDLRDPAAGWAGLPPLPVARAYATGGGSGQTFSVAGGFAASYNTYSETQQYTEVPCAATATPAASNTATPLSVPSATPPATASRTATATPGAPSATPPGTASRTATATAGVPSATPAATGTAGPSATPCISSFADVHPADYFYTPVLYLACHGVISGYADGTFRPFAQTTRSQMVKIVVLGFALPVSTPAGGGVTFADVPPRFPFFAAVETAAGRGLVSGYRCGGPGEPCDGHQRPYFRPYANVTRGQLAKIDVLGAGWALQTPGAGRFADVLPGSAFYSFVETAACHGVISGYACGGPGESCDPQGRPYFRQATPATRGQIAKIVYLSVSASGGCARPAANG